MFSEYPGFTSIAREAVTGGAGSIAERVSDGHDRRGLQIRRASSTSTHRRRDHGGPSGAPLDHARPCASGLPDGYRNDSALRKLRENGGGRDAGCQLGVGINRATWSWETWAPRMRFDYTVMGDKASIWPPVWRGPKQGVRDEYRQSASSTHEVYQGTSFSAANWTPSGFKGKEAFPSGFSKLLGDRKDAASAAVCRSLRSGAGPPLSRGLWGEAIAAFRGRPRWSITGGFSLSAPYRPLSGIEGITSRGMSGTASLR